MIYRVSFYLLGATICYIIIIIIIIVVVVVVGGR